jgi:hypothetical protein
MTDMVWERMERLEKTLSSIEGKLDRILVIEERQRNQTEETKRAFGRLNNLEDRVRVIEIEFGKSDTKTKGNSNVLWAGFTFLLAVASSIIAYNLR